MEVIYSFLVVVSFVLGLFCGFRIKDEQAGKTADIAENTATEAEKREERKLLKQWEELMGYRGEIDAGEDD